MVLHALSGIDDFGLAALRNLGQSAAGAVIGRGEHEMIVNNRRGAIGGSVGGFIIAPKELAVRGGHADHTPAQKLHVLPLPVDVGGDDRGISGAVAAGNLAFPRSEEHTSELQSRSDLV